MNFPSTPVAPGRWPLLGHTPSLLRHRFGFTSSLADHGDLVRVYLGPVPAYMVTSPALIHQMLVTDGKKFDKGMLFDRFRPVWGNGIAISNGAFHARQRRLMQPAFHVKRIAGYADVMSEVARGMAGSWHAGQVVQVDQAMLEVSITVAGRTLFSTELGKAAIAEARRSLPVVIKQGMVRALSPGFVTHLPIPGNHQFDQAIQRLHGIVFDVIAEGRAQQEDRGDILSMLLATPDEDTGEPMTDQQVYDEVITLLTGSGETVMLAMSWFFHEIARHPALERRWHEEIDQFGGRPLTYEDLPKLRYTAMVCKEVLRRYPIWLLMRRTNTEVDLGGTLIPPRTEVAFSPHALHHDPRFHPDPYRFDPDRWDTSKTPPPPQGAYVPFSDGSRKCIGNHFALAEMAITTATIGSRWRLVPVPGRPVRIKVTGAAYPSQLPMTVEQRTV
ncbi:cytochrome P450 [Kibdelosporangium phytohabitans]|uniref:Cytochrome n=1 Tax=Kibdelosporangium phytohabitans TaxID=860235 RepID=A0A0N9I9V8_9PSEU|nr:cytochrome P450 [Kibdelosporangium phytohabitans]ALG11802.1 cytochrome [Kibdelosporangium phytohabitans]MBE1463212.1 cytochrome P450 [Kibdelosporangium phytohabitans]